MSRKPVPLPIVKIVPPRLRHDEITNRREPAASSDNACSNVVREDNHNASIREANVNVDEVEGIQHDEDGSIRPIRSKCAQCSHFIRSKEGTKIKSITTEEAADQMTARLGKRINVGDKLCQKCRLLAYKKPKPVLEPSHVTENPTVGVTQASVQNVSAIQATNQNNVSVSGGCSDNQGGTTHIANANEQNQSINTNIYASFSGVSMEPIIQLRRCREYNVKPDEVQQCSSSTQFWDILSSSSSSQPCSQGSTLSDPTFDTPPDRTVKEELSVEMPFSRPVATHRYCFICNETNDSLKVVPWEARLRTFAAKKIFIPKNNRICENHLIGNRLFANDIEAIRIVSLSSWVPVSELTRFLNALSSHVDKTLLSQLGDFSISEERVRALTGYTLENIIELGSLLKSMRKTKNRNIYQALVIFLHKMRTSSSDEIIASLFGLERKTAVSEIFNAVIEGFKTDILPTGFGVHSVTRQDLIDNHTSIFARELFNIRNNLAVICDGTYLRHQKSSNNAYQRKSYSGQKKTHLIKPFTICATDGFLIDIAGPFEGTMNDAKILENVLADPNGLSTLLQEGDVFILDRGFRDVVPLLKEKKFKVLMPALRGKQKQLTTQQSNCSRFVTKLRWVVESIHGTIGSKNKLLHHQLDNKLLPNSRALCRIAGFLFNKFGRRLNSDQDMQTEIIRRMKDRLNVPNDLAVEKEEKRWERRKTLFTGTLSSTAILDFPELGENELILFFTGKYQLKQAISYLGELLRDNTDLSDIPVHVLKEDISGTKTLKIDIRSRHISSQTYRCFIRYKPNINGIDGISGYSCQCVNGNRTIGSCAHIATIIYYLAYARFQAKIVRPMEQLTKLFETNNYDEEVIINEDSEEDD